MIDQRHCAVTQSWLARVCLATVSLAAIFAGGCTDGARPSWFNKNKNAAQQRWDRVRSDVRLELARAELSKGHYEEAAAQLATAEAQTPALPGLDLLKAKVLIARGDFFGAEPLLRAVLDTDPYSSEGQYLLGSVLQQSGRLDQAVEHYQTASALERTNNEYALAVAECCLSAGQAQAALEWLQELYFAPGGLDSSYQYHLLLGETYRMLGDAAQAALAYENAFHLGADDAHTLAAAGDIYMTMQDYRRASELLEPLVDEQKDSSPGLVMALARCLLETGRPEEARTRLGILVRGYDDPWAWLMLGQASAQCGELAAALGNVKRALALDSDNVAAYQVQAGLALQVGDYGLAASAAERAAQLGPTDPLNYCLLADLSHLQDNRERAVRLYRDALQLDPDCQAARTALLRLSPQFAADAP